MRDLAREGDKGVTQMANPIAEATAYIEKLEAARQAAIEMSERKAAEAKLIAARQEGVRAAIEIFAGAIPVDFHELEPEKSGSRRRRRDISELIVRELSFSGQEMTTAQIAKAIAYIPERTETVLKRLEKNGEIVRNENGRWVAQVTHKIRPNGHGSAAEDSERIPTC
jgi:predicted transcriptional regulator